MVKRRPGQWVYLPPPWAVAHILRRWPHCKGKSRETGWILESWTWWPLLWSFTIHLVLVNPRFGLTSDAENSSATVGSHGWSQPSVSSMYLIAQYPAVRQPRSRFSSWRCLLSTVLFCWSSSICPSVLFSHCSKCCSWLIQEHVLLSNNSKKYIITTLRTNTSHLICITIISYQTCDGRRLRASIHLDPCYPSGVSVRTRRWCMINNGVCGIAGPDRLSHLMIRGCVWKKMWEKRRKGRYLRFIDLISSFFFVLLFLELIEI